MNEKRAIIERAVDQVLQPHGFHRKGVKWTKNKEECVLVVFFQKSQYGDSYYIVCGVAVLALHEKRPTSVEQCDVRVRLETLTSQAVKYNAAIRLDGPDMKDDERAEVIGEAIREVALPFLLAWDSLDKIRAHVLEGGCRTVYVRPQLRALCSGNV